MRCSGPRGPGGVGLRRPPPPNPRGPGASEPPAGLGAAKLERATCAAPVRCPNPPEARKARSSGAPQPLPFALPRPPLCPHAKPSTFLREQTSHRQAHRQTHRHSHAPTPRETAGLRKLLTLQSLATNGNWMSKGKRLRGRWAKEMEFPIKNATEEPVENLWFVGDTASFDELVIPNTK